MSDLLAFLQSHEDGFRSRTRLASLYSDFRYQRQTNPDGFQANTTAWLNALGKAAQQGLLSPSSISNTGTGDCFVLHTGPELLNALQTQEHGRPLALGVVVDEGIKKKRLVSLREFRDTTKSIYAQSWLPSPWQVLSWGFKQLGVVGEDHGIGGDDKLSKGEFVIVANVEAAAKAVLDQAADIATSNISKIFTRDLFAATFSKAAGVDRLSTRDLSVLLTYLVRDREAISYSSSTGTIKFKAADEIRPSPVTEEDASIASIRSLIVTLEPQIDEVTTQIAKLDQRARDAVAKRQLTSAKAALRSKKIMESRLQARSATLNQLEDVYAKIEQAADQVELVRIMEAASHTLKSLNAQTGGVDKVQDVVDDLREQMLDVDEIGHAINDASNNAIDEDEVEDELEQLERVEKEKQSEAKRKAQEDSDRLQADKLAANIQEMDRMSLDDRDGVGGKETAAKEAVKE